MDSAQQERGNNMLIFHPTEITEISSPYGERINPVTQKLSFHSGVDFPTPMRANAFPAWRGHVAKTGYDSGGYGRYLVINHDGYSTLYAHLDEILVKEGQYVDRKTIIAKTGNTGLSTGPHLHFELRDEIFNDNYFNKRRTILSYNVFTNIVNPVKYLPAEWERTVMSNLTSHNIITSEHHPKDYPTFAILGEMFRKSGLLDIKQIIDENLLGEVTTEQIIEELEFRGRLTKGRILNE